MMELQKVVDGLNYMADGRTIVLYTGRDTNRECAEHLASQLPMRCQWIHWDGKDADSEPPIYVPVVDPGVGEGAIMKYMGEIAELCTRLGASIVTGDTHQVYIPNTGGVLWMDTAVDTDSVIFVGISEEYEDYLD